MPFLMESLMSSFGIARRLLSQSQRSAASTDTLGGPQAHADFGCRLVALSGRVGLDGLVHGAEMLSPLLSGLQAEEQLTAEMAIAPGGVTVGLRGSAFAPSLEAAAERAAHLGRLLQALVRSQFPGFVLRPIEAGDGLPSEFGAQCALRPAGRALSLARRSKPELGPVAVESREADLVLPAMRFSAEGLSAAVELLKAELQRAVMRLNMRLVHFDAALLRRLAAARDAVGDRRPLTELEALRHLSEAIPADAVMPSFLNERAGVELELAVHTEAPLGAAAQRMLCHAAFRMEPESDTPAEGNLGSVYPRGFVLGQAVAGLAAVALLSFQRAPATYEPPARVASTPALTLGTTPDGRPVVITEADRAMHQFIIGATGTGKSTLLLNQIASDMRAGEGMLVLDPHGDLWEAARRLVPPERARDLVLAHLGDPQHAFTMNVLAGLGGDPAVERSATVNGLIRLMKNTLWPDVQEAFGPMFELYFRNALLLLMEAQGDAATILDFERLFIDADFRNELLDRCTTQSVRDFWRKTAAHVSGDHSLENLVPYIVCKLAPFTTNKLLAPMLGSPASSLDIKAAIAEGRIVLINLAKGIIGAGSARLVGGLIAMRLTAAAQTQMVLPYERRRPFVAYLDEFQTYADEHISEAIEETRKYRLRLVLACQSLSQVDGRNRRADVGASILANVANLVSFRLGVGDAHTLAPWFQPMVRPEDLIYLPNHIAVGRLLVAVQAVRPVEFRTAPPPSACGPAEPRAERRNAR
jgi:hypothetical protein